jgi:cyclopropane-fatty-acyl-phospholipid synthase
MLIFERSTPSPHRIAVHRSWLILTREAAMAQQTINRRVEQTSHLAHAARFLDIVLPRPRDFDIRLWDGSLLAADSAPKCRLSFKRPGTLRRVFAPPVELNAAEAFVRGEFDIDGSIMALFDAQRRVTGALVRPQNLATALQSWLMLPNDDDLESAGVRERANLHGRPHSKSRDSAAIRFHYDIGNPFYQLFLDQRMVYSCAYFPTGAETLDSAQAAKLDMICRKLLLQPGERLLDIGCGWAALLIHAAKHYGVSALGVTLSERQYELGTQRIPDAGLAGRAEIRLMDYRDLNDGEWDKLASIGMFEHVGRAHLPEYFEKCHRLLRPGGLFLNHGISKRPNSTVQMSSIPRRLIDQRILGTGSFSNRHIFPDGELVAVSDANAVAESVGFEVRDVENWREHYALTLRHWLSRLDAQRDEAIRIGGETLYRTWRLYLAGSADGFDTARLNVNQSLLAKLDQGRSGLPWSRRHLYD